MMRNQQHSRPPRVGLRVIACIQLHFHSFRTVRPLMLRINRCIGRRIDFSCLAFIRKGGTGIFITDARPSTRHQIGHGKDSSNNTFCHLGWSLPERQHKMQHHLPASGGDLWTSILAAFATQTAPPSALLSSPLIDTPTDRRAIHQSTARRTIHHRLPFNPPMAYSTLFIVTARNFGSSVRLICSLVTRLL